jgi:ABC-type phosphate transport system substrate-binding protein
LRRIFIPLASLLLVASASNRSVAADAPVKVVAHPLVKGTQIPRAALASIFLKQAPRWSDGSAVLPVDQSVKSPVRSAFCNRLLGQPLIDVQIYWQKKMSVGVVPPPVKTSDEDVLGYVASTPGAIGYISSGTSVPEGVKTLEVTD